MGDPTYRARVEGCLYGLAFGDAIGAATTPLKYADILARFGPLGPAEPAGKVGDATRMMLAVGEALIAGKSLSSAAPEELTDALRAQFLTAAATFGDTTRESIAALSAGKDWHDGTNVGSKGCGATVRVAPVALLTDRHGFTVKKRARLAQLQAAMTHGHPTAVTASDATAHAIHLLAAGLEPGDLPQRLIDYAHSQRGVYHDETLGYIWRRAGESSGSMYITRGWNEVLHALEKLHKALERPNHDADPGTITGHGWMAEEALATALHCFLLFPLDPASAIRRAAATGGDSGSIACIAGALAGVYHGIEAWPAAWRERIEYRERIQALANRFAIV
jgi:ADP-ribosylglycohydrolase